LRKHLDGVVHVLINDANILSKKYTSDLLGFPNVASIASFDSILALGIRTLGTPNECFFHIIITCFLMQLLGNFFKKKMYNKTSKEMDIVKFEFKVIEICFKLKFGYLHFTLNNEY
jgi:hypothetical protein